jgi:hypothetical protein
VTGVFSCSVLVGVEEWSLSLSRGMSPGPGLGAGLDAAAGVGLAKLFPAPRMMWFERVQTARTGLVTRRNADLSAQALLSHCLSADTEHRLTALQEPKWHTWQPMTSCHRHRLSNRRLEPFAQLSHSFFDPLDRRLREIWDDTGGQITEGGLDVDGSE